MRNPERQGWNPFRELDDFHERMARLLESSIGDASVTGWVPAVDIEETDEAFVVEAELPGVKRKDVNVELQNNELRIHGEIKERERKGILRRQTRRTGEFEYRVVLPGEADPDSVEASLKDGVLQVQVRKAAPDKPRHIEVTGD
jgi:HSP20 family protein